MERNPQGPDRESVPAGAKETSGPHDRSSTVRKDQHPPVQPKPGDQGSHHFGEGGFAAGGTDDQSGYGGEYGQLQPSQRHEGSVEQAGGGEGAEPGGIEGTPSDSNR